MNVAEVKIWDESVGAVAWDEKAGMASFEYEPKFKKLGWELAPLKMPLNSAKNILSFPELRAGIKILNTILSKACPAYWLMYCLINTEISSSTSGWHSKDGLRTV
jgi:hypothetical protein